jgi:hypothetical protein
MGAAIRSVLLVLSPAQSAAQQQTYCNPAGDEPGSPTSIEDADKARAGLGNFQRAHRSGSHHPTTAAAAVRLLRFGLRTAAPASAQAVADACDGNNRFAVGLDRFAENILYLSGYRKVVHQRLQHFFGIDHGKLLLASDAVSSYFD